MFLGEFSALLASICFSIGPTLNTLAGQRVNPSTVNRTRLLITLVLLVIPHWLTQGVPFPVNGGATNWVFLSLSGLFALIIGDTLMFAAFNAIGTRLTMLIFCLSPVFSSLMALFLLDEKLTSLQMVGILVTLTGIAWVVTDSNNGVSVSETWKIGARGFWLAFGASFFHAAGSIAAKQGLAGDFPAISAHMMRTLVSLILIMFPLLLRRQVCSTVLELREKSDVMKYLFWGAVFGPVLGVWSSLFAIQHTNVGIATSLTSLSPVWLLPVGHYFFKERIGVPAVMGSLVAVMGVAIMLVSPG